MNKLDYGNPFSNNFSSEVISSVLILFLFESIILGYLPDIFDFYGLFLFYSII